MTGLWIAIPVIQLVPLPPALWHNLPGRALEASALQLIGDSQSWRPISLAPYATLASGLSLIPPITALFFVSQLSTDERSRLLYVVVALTTLAALMGVLQVSGGASGQFSLYGTSPGFATGFQANRNAAADVLLIGCAALTSIAIFGNSSMGTRIFTVMFCALYLFMFLSTVLTGSRTGTVLIIVPLVGLIILGLHKIGIKRYFRRRALIVSMALLGAVACIIFVLLSNAQLDRTIVRFSNGPSVRLDYWKDTIYATRIYWPFGSGMGTFQQVFKINERLEGVSEIFVNRAHNDYLEFILEAGLAGGMLILGTIGSILLRLRSKLRYRGDVATLGQIAFGVMTLTVLGLHSLVDYPMRSMSLASLGALACGALAQSRVRRGDFSE